jgi:hypothetical protein
MADHPLEGGQRLPRKSDTDRAVEQRVQPRSRPHVVRIVRVRSVDQEIGVENYL